MLTYEDLTIFNLIIYWTLQIITIWCANSFYINKYLYSSILFSQSLSIILFLFDTIMPHRSSNAIAILRHDADVRMTEIVFFWSSTYSIHSVCILATMPSSDLYMYIPATYTHTSGIWTWRSLNDIFHFVRQLPICTIGVIRFSAFVPYNNIIIITTMKNQAD